MFLYGEKIPYERAKMAIFGVSGLFENEPTAPLARAETSARGKSSYEGSARQKKGPSFLLLLHTGKWFV